MDHRLGRVEWGAGNDRKRTSSANWRLPFKWDKMAADSGHKSFVFCLSLGDIWDNEVDPTWRRDAIEVMERTPNLIYLLLSKRIGNAVKMCSATAGHRALPPNAALGATMIDQPEWDRDNDKLLDAAERLGALFTFASVEPMLGPINARGRLPSWVIVGGESGDHARPMHPDWARSLRDQCVAAGVPFHFKQHGEWSPYQAPGAAHDIDMIWPDGRRCNTTLPAIRPSGERHSDGAVCVARVGKKAAGALLDGREWRQMPRGTGV